jgi:hypothetical protein
MVSRCNEKAPPLRTRWAHLLATFGPDRVDASR